MPCLFIQISIHRGIIVFIIKQICTICIHQIMILKIDVYLNFIPLKGQL
jgi:hypothetical protein